VLLSELTTVDHAYQRGLAAHRRAGAQGAHHAA
jgi:hypothetical protein